MARSITFVIYDKVDTQITVTENDDGTLTFDLLVLDSGKIGDLRALFFDLNGLVADDSLTVTSGDYVTESVFDEANVDTVGGDGNVSGSVTNEFGEFDVGIGFGTSGPSEDDLQSTSFTLAHASQALSLDLIDMADFGIRTTSVGMKAGDTANGVGQSDVLNVDENAVGDVDLLANDSSDGTVAVNAVSDDDGDFDAVPAGFERDVTFGGLALGILTVGTDGIASFSATGADVDQLSEGQQVFVSFTYQTVAPDGSLATADVTLMITGQNDGPILSAGTLDAEEDGSAVTLDLSTLGADIDGDDDGTTLTYSLVGTPAEGTASILGSILTFDPGTDFQDLNDNETRNVVLTIQAEDSQGAVTTNTVTVTVTGENDASPPEAVADMLTAVEDTTATFDVLDNDTDPDAGDVLTVAFINGTSVGIGDSVATANGTVTVNADWTLDYTAATHYSGPDSFTYQISDGIFLSNVATATIDVTPVADAPTLSLTSGTGGGGSDPTPVPQGTAQLVNTETSDIQQFATVTALEGGGFVVIWSSLNQDGNAWGVYGQLYDNTGAQVAGEFQVNTTTYSWQRYATVAADENGGFTVSWSSYGVETDINSFGIVARSYDANAVAQSGELLVNNITASEQQQSRIDALDGGGYAVVWSSGAGQTGLNRSLQFRSLDTNGVPQGAETTVAAGVLDTYDVAGLDGGGSVVVWSIDGGDASGYGILAQEFDSAGVAVGSPVQVNTETTGDQRSVTVEALVGGGYVVAWESDGQDGSGDGIFAQRFNATSAAVGPEFQVNTYFFNDQSFPSITALGDGGFVVTWNSSGQDGSFEGIYAQRFDASGNPVGNEYIVNDVTAGRQTNYYRDATTELTNGQIATVFEQDFGDVYLRLTDIPSEFDGTAGQPFDIALDAALVDTDGSETLRVTLSGYPAGTTFNLGSEQGGVWVIDNAQAVDLSTLQATTPAEFSGDFTLTATARATEGANGDFAEMTASANFSVAPQPQPPLFTEGIDLINFGNPAAGSFGLVEAGTYLEGTQYDALGGDDDVFLPLTQVDADLAGYDLTQSFNLGDGDDFFRGSLLDDQATGGEGRDRMEGLDGDDTLLGEGGNDNIFGGAGDDVMDGGSGNDIINWTGSGAGVTVDTSAGTATGEGSDTFSNFEQYRTSNFADTVTGSAAAESFRLNDGNDQIDAGAGNDIILPGAGDDIVDGGLGVDQVSYVLASAAVTVDLGAGTATGGDGNDLLSNIESVVGSQYDDVLIASSAGDVLLGQDGDDTITGGVGDDDLHGQSGDDTITGGSGADTFNFFLNQRDVGSDTITDFEVNIDTLRIAGGGFTTLGDLNPTEPVSGGVLLDLGGGQSILLEGVSLVDLDDDDFIF